MLDISVKLIQRMVGDDMHIYFNQEEILALKDIGINLKDAYSDEELLEIDEAVSIEVMNHFIGDKPLPKALIYESILDKIADLEG